MMELQTKRTLLRPLLVSDASDFFALNEDPEVIRYTGDRSFSSLAEAENFLKAYKQYELFKVGRFAVIDRASKLFIGWSGLKYTPEHDEYDLGFRFFKRFWNKGYATETALACLNYGFSTLKIEEVVGRAMSRNEASIAVLEKLQMKYQKSIDFCGQVGVEYRIHRNDFYGTT